MAKKVFKEKIMQRKPSKNVVDIRPAQRKARAKANKEVMDLITPYNDTLRTKDLKRTKDSSGSTKLANTISASDPNRGKRLAKLKDKNPKPTTFKKK